MRASAVPALVLTVAAAGCSSTQAPGAAEVRSSIEKANSECRLQRESRVSLGGLKLWGVKTLTRLAGESNGVETLSHIQRVEVVTYRATSSSSCTDHTWLEPFRQEMATWGWRPMVMERDDSDATWVLARYDAQGDLDSLFVVTIDGGELEVVRVEGRIDRLIADAVAEDPREAAEILANLTGS